MKEKVNTLSLSFKLISFRKGYFFWRVVGLSLYFLFPLLSSYIIKQIFDTLVGKQAVAFGLWTLILILPLVYIGRILFKITTTILEYMFVLSVQTLIRTNTLDGVLKKPGAQALGSSSSGEVISRFRGDTTEIAWFVSYLAYVVSYSFFFIAGFFTMYSIHRLATLFVTLPFVLILVVIYLGRNRQKNYRRKARKATGEVLGFLSQVFGSVQSIKVNSAEENTQRYFERLNAERSNVAVKDRTFTAILSSFGPFIMSLSTGLLLLIVGADMQAGRFTVGDFAYFIMLLNWMFSYVNVIAELTAWQTRVNVSLVRIRNLIEGDEKDIVKHRTIFSPKFEQKETKREEIEPLQYLEISDLSLVREGEQGMFQLDNITFRINRGEFIVVTGKVGSGKSTLIRAMLGLLEVTRGEIYWNGKKISDPSNFLVPPRVSYTPQIPTLFSYTIEENLLMGLDRTPKEVQKSIRLAVLDRDVKELEKGLQTVIGTKGVKLSGGQKHRVATARMLLRDSELIVIDDISSALDVKTEKEMWKNLLGSSNHTFVVVSHRPSVLERADRIIVLDEGQISGQGDLETLLTNNSIMQEIWRREEIEMAPHTP